MRAMLNGQEFQSLFLVVELSQPKRELLYPWHNDVEKIIDPRIKFNDD